MREYTVREYDAEDYNKLRDNMTVEETIDNLRKISRGWLPDYNYSGSESDYDVYKLHIAINKAISALKGE